MTPYQIAQRFIGMKEIPGSENNPQIMAMLKLDGDWPEDDEVPWCSAFVNYCAWILRFPRSKSLRARSWLTVGVPIELITAEVGDVVVLERGKGLQPGPEVIDAPGHVGFYVNHMGDLVYLLGGNQNNMVSVHPYDKDRILGIRRLV